MPSPASAAIRNLEEPLGKMISDLDEILEFSTLHAWQPRQGPQDTRHRHTRLYTSLCMVLDEFWVEQKRTSSRSWISPGRLRRNEGEKRHIPKHGKFVRKSADGDAGLLFAHKCLKELELRESPAAMSAAAFAR